MKFNDCIKFTKDRKGKDQNYFLDCKFTKKEINYLVDRNPLKDGCKAIGSNIPIISEEKAKELKPDYYLLLPYFFEKEIAKREKDFLFRGGKIIVPLPDIKIIKRKKI